MGSLALTIYGFPRATFDIDVLIRPESLEKAYKIAAEFEFDIRGLDMSLMKAKKETDEKSAKEKQNSVETGRKIK